MGRIRILPHRVDPTIPELNDLAGAILNVCDEKPGDLISMALAIAQARVSRACIDGGDAEAWRLAVSALGAGFAFDQRNDVVEEP